MARSLYAIVAPPSSRSMKDLSFFLLKNQLASKMKKGFRNFCHGVASTSTLKQKAEADVSCVAAAPSVETASNTAAGSPLTLEQMILQLDMEEAAARRRERGDDGGGGSETHRRMSCVNNSDILRSARNALSQYPRFSLDGRDAMYRASFRGFGARPSDFEGGDRGGGGRRSACCCSRFLGGACRGGYQLDLERNLCLPPTLAGESVVWCKPGIVAKLMGLDAVPVPVGGGGRERKQTAAAVANASGSRKHWLRRNGRQELEKERINMGLLDCRGRAERESTGSCSGYCLLNPISGGRSSVERGFGRIR